MSTAAIVLTEAQICRNTVEDAREYQDECITELTGPDYQTYSRTFMHAAMISHWSTLFHEPILTMLTNFRSTPSIAIPAACNLNPPPIFPTASGAGTITEDPELELVMPQLD